MEKSSEPESSKNYGQLIRLQQLKNGSEMCKASRLDEACNWGAGSDLRGVVQVLNRILFRYPTTELVLFKAMIVFRMMIDYWSGAYSTRTLRPCLLPRRPFRRGAPPGAPDRQRRKFKYKYSSYYLNNVLANKQLNNY